MTAPTTDRPTERAEWLATTFPGFTLPDNLVQIIEELQAPGLDDMFGTYEVAKRLGIDHDKVTKVAGLLDRPNVAMLRYVCEIGGWKLSEAVAVDDPFTPDEVAQIVAEATAQVVVDEVPVEPAKPARVDTAPAWEWDGTKGYNSAREWSTAMLSCTHIGPAAKNLATLYREVGHMERGDAYLGPEWATAVLGCNLRNFKEKRKEVRDAGWLVDTGRTTGHPWFLPIYEFGMGHCGCRAPELNR